MYGCQQVLVSPDKDLIAILTFLCEESHKLTNMGIYYARQLYFKAKKAIGKFDLEKIYKTNYHYRVLHSQAAQQILRNKELRILPRNKCFYFEFISHKEVVKLQLNSDNVLGIDPGLNNWLTCVSNLGTSFIVDGKHIKSMNRWYNKQVSTLKENKPQEFWRNKLAAITEKRKRKMHYGVNKAARMVIKYCRENNIGTILWLEQR